VQLPDAGKGKNPLNDLPSRKVARGKAMKEEFGVTWGDRYGTAIFPYGDVIADIAAYCHAHGVDGTTVWLENIRGKARLTAEHTDRVFAKVVCVRGAGQELSEDEVQELNSGQTAVLRIAFPSGAYQYFYPLSLKDNFPFEHRHWSTNSADCYRLGLSYYKGVLGINVPEILTPESYLLQMRSYSGLNLFLENWRTSGFVQVISPQDGDVILMRMGGGSQDGPDHCAIYLDGDRILHHFRNRMSTIQEYAGVWREKTVMVLRHRTRL
jgi:hypothetical protein